MKMETVERINPVLSGIRTGVTRYELEKLTADLETKSIQFVKPLSRNEIDDLERYVFSKRPDIMLRIYGHYGEVCNLTFLERIPSLRKVSADCLMDVAGIETVCKLRDLELLGVGIFNLQSFDFLNDISPTLKRLYLHLTRSKKPRIDSISRFSDLEYLYLEGQQKGIEEIRHLHKLKSIVLRSISTENIDYLKGLDELWSVDIKLGGIKNFDALTMLTNLKYLELWLIRGLFDLSFISELTTLQSLFIQSLKQVKQLPDFSRCNSLRRIYLEDLKGLDDMSSLKTAKVLEEFIFVMAQNQEPEDLIPVLENHAVKKVSCGFGSIRKNERFDKMTFEYNKSQYKYTEFEYK